MEQGVQQGVEQVDAIVIGAGHNGLVAAAVLARAGWDVLVLEAADRPGGAIASIPSGQARDGSPEGYVTDLFSSFHPLAAASPVIDRLDLAAHGLRWSRSPAVVGHPASDTAGRAAVLEADAEATAAGLDHPADGETWLRLTAQYRSIREPLLTAITTPMPPLRALTGVLRRTGVADGLRLARMLALPVHRLGEELFRGQDGRLLLAGNAMHADIPADAPGSGMFGWLMAMLGQDVGFPVPEGGAGALADALTRAVIAAGGQVRTSAPVEEILVSGGAATGVRLAGGARIGARRAVVADVGAHQLYRELLPGAVVPPRLQADLDRFDWDLPTVKVNWSLKGRVPWRAAGLDRTACVHLGADADELVRWSADLGSGRVPERPFMLLGQMAVADASRAPAGGDSVWAYSHLPRAGTRHRAGDRAGDSAGDRETLAAQAKELAARMTAVVEAHAPGFTGQIADVLVQAPGDLAGADANLVHGTINGGTAQLHQQLVFRPVPGLGRPETVVPGLYLASAAGHPGGGVHGGAGAMAARVALRDARWRRLPGRALSAASRTLYAPARRPWPGD